MGSRKVTRSFSRGPGEAVNAREHRSSLSLLLLCALVTLSGGTAEPGPEKSPPPQLGQDEPRDSSQESGALAAPAAELEVSMERGIAFLLESQNKDGSWGSARNTKGLNITLRCRARTWLSGRRHGPSAFPHSARPGAARGSEESLDRAETWLEENLPRVRRATPDALYNCWPTLTGSRPSRRCSRGTPGRRAAREGSAGSSKGK